MCPSYMMVLKLWNTLAGNSHSVTKSEPQRANLGDLIWVESCIFLTGKKKILHKWDIVSALCSSLASVLVPPALQDLCGFIACGHDEQVLDVWALVLTSGPPQEAKSLSVRAGSFGRSA